MHGVTTPSLFQLKMAAIVCHGQSSLDSHHHLIHTHRLRKPPLTPSHHLSYLEQTPNHHKTTPQNNTSLISYSKSCEGGWGFVPSSLSREEKETAPYVHPQVKLSSVRMSPKSLELCTENLGNESGTDIMGDSGIHVFTSSEQSTCTSSTTQCFGGNKKKMKKKKIAKTKSFPPPLTTMRGSESIQVRPHREGGRLVIEITKAPSTSSSCFRAQRSHGRLRLSLLDHQEEEEEEEEEEFEGEVEDEEETEEEEGDKRCGVRIEREKKRRSSCKEEGDHENIIRNWEWGESIWVATS
ncbi:hypothetical protein HN51_069140 [Arachis hypogaea]|uniref:FAF domain-containing protein n=1 Tax=Arachis hypogaea TaxID=3818 RepID=A0A444Z7F0_ARAHY|nr:protein FANTASTIC FOUR 3 isoform X1 [Arachis ipaensis]XP_025654110.1 protein FANTASTIC FOUR 3 [Arachis hypogaea]QHO11354.1 Protein FANTASTIC FOUR [Arachis hypogaea]RYR10102.1 hypothetical protein Ahy_B05g078573 [Arachis hypogaea]